MLTARNIERVVLNTPFFIFLVALAAVPALVALFLVIFLIKRRRGKKLSRGFKICWAVVSGLFAFEAGCFLWGYFVEPNLLSVTRITLHNPKIKDDTRIRIVHISDLHVTGPAKILDKVVAETNRLKPDFIVLTGDYIGSDNPSAPDVLLKFLKGLKPRVASYAIYGGWETLHDPSLQFGLAGIDLIDKKMRTMKAGGATIVFSGLRMRSQFDYFSSPEAAQTINIALDHTPDRIYDVSDKDVDYYFCGHTHGGQVRLPFYGALLTFSKYGKRFEMGQYKVGNTTMNVSRGVGLEGATPLKVRFLCRPEIVVYDITR